MKVSKNINKYVIIVWFAKWVIFLCILLGVLNYSLAIWEKADENMTTNLATVKEDFEKAVPNTEVELEKIDNVLEVTIYEYNDIEGMLPRIVITRFTDWGIKNIKSDILYLDITIINKDLKYNCKLKMTQTIDDYFNEMYVEEKLNVI